MGLWSRKSVEALRREAEGPRPVTLRRALGLGHLIMIGIGATIGAGIFVLTGTAAAQFAGPAIVFSFLLAGLACLFAGLCYAEFAALIPVAGSAYTYAYATLGELIAWIIGWDLMLEYLFGASTVAVGWSGYMGALLEQLGLRLPDRLTRAPFSFDPHLHAWHHTGAICNLPAIALLIGLTLLLAWGIRQSARANAAAVAIKLAIVLLVIVFGLPRVHAANWHPFIPPNRGHFGEFGPSGIVRGAAVIFFAYVGFDATSTAAQEARHPQRDMPLAILGALAICTLLYVLMSLVMTGLAPYRELDVAHPVFVAVSYSGAELAWLGYLVNLGAVLGLASVTLVMLLGQTRILFSMAQDGLLPPVFASIHPRLRTPITATLVTGFSAAAIAGLFPITLLGELVSIGTLFAFVVVCAGIWVLRRRQPALPRPFRTPLVPLIPILAIGSCIYLMLGLPRDTWIRLVVWMALGLALYFGYGRGHSRQNRVVR